MRSELNCIAGFKKVQLFLLPKAFVSGRLCRRLVMHFSPSIVWHHKTNSFSPTTEGVLKVDEEQAMLITTSNKNICGKKLMKS